MKNILSWICLVIVVQLPILTPPATAQASSQVQWVLRQEKLESVRQEIVFPEMNSYEKQVLVEQARIFMEELYVNRYDKLSYYSYLTDPVSLINELVQNIDKLSTEELEEQLSHIFTSQRDLHLQHIFPPPYKNYASFLPLKLTRTAGEENFFEVRVNSVSQDRFETFAPGQRIPQVGDRVIGYNKVPIREAVQQKIATARGANQYGGFARAIDAMTFIPHRLHMVPVEDEVEVTLMSSQNGEDQFGSLYTITLPWIATWWEQVSSPQLLLRSLSNLRQQNLKQEPLPAKKILPEDFELLSDPSKESFNKHVVVNNLQPFSAYPSNPSNEPKLSWGLIDNKFGRFGYLRLTSFVPDMGVDFAIEEIRSIVTEEFQDTDGLIFDVRDNTGGWARLADSLPQLFSRNEVQMIKVRLLNTDLNRRIFNEGNPYFSFHSKWAKLINDAAGTGNLYTEALSFTHVDQANKLGQIYYKPVGVLTNAISYSATDLFACAMQDNEAGILYGEDPTTGAGGANIVSHRLFNYILPSVFEALPVNHGMAVSWRQMVRFGENEGKIVEDFGCLADELVSKTRRDIVTGHEDQILKITESLAELAEGDDYKASVRPMAHNYQLVMERGESYSLFVKETEYVDVFANGELVDQVPAYDSEEETHIAIQLPADLPAGALYHVVFKGRDDDGETLWNLKRDILIPGEKVVVGAEGFEMDFGLTPTVEPLVIVNQGLTLEGGWSLKAPYLQVGYESVYNNSLDSDAMLLMDLSKRSSAKLSVDLAYHTEEHYDFIEIYVTDNKGNQVSLLRGSGKQDLRTFNFDLSSFAGQDRVALHFRFTSDGALNFPGVRLRRFIIQ